MGSMDGILVGVFVTLIMISIGYLAITFHRTRRIERQKQREMMEAAITAAKSLSESMDSYISAVKSATDPLSTVPNLVQGLVKISAAQVVEINKLRDTVKEFKGILFKKEDVRGFEAPSEAEKDLWWNVKEEMTKDPSMSKEDALARVLDKLGGAGSREEEFSL